jgi:nitrate/nitrite transport system ATP-binding protein
MKKRAFLALEDIAVTFPTKQGLFTAIQGVNLSIHEGEYVALIGHSGCGKSTLLNVIAGLNKASRGVVFLENTVVDKPGVDRAVVFQDHSLLPWLTVAQNVALAVDKVFAKTKSGRERDDWVMHNLSLVNMTHAKDKRPAEISGGMKQRVGIARAIAMQPRILLLDEPFGALDALTRATLQDTVMDIQSKLKQTVVMITHDVDEAVLLADRVIMMTNGPSATIGEDLTVNLPRPRHRLKLAENQQYIEARKAILSFLYDRFAHPAEAA